LKRKISPAEALERLLPFIFPPHIITLINYGGILSKWNCKAHDIPIYTATIN